jgi:hypothetical protein
MNFFYPEFRVLSNRRLDAFEYDIILETTVTNEIDYIFEVKYYPWGYDKFSLQEAIIRLELSTKYYIDKTKRIAKPILVIVVQRGNFIKEQFEEINTFSSRKLTYFKAISTLTIYFDGFDKLNKDILLKLLHNE